MSDHHPRSTYKRTDSNRSVNLPDHLIPKLYYEAKNEEVSNIVSTVNNSFGVKHPQTSHAAVHNNFAGQTNKSRNSSDASVNSTIHEDYKPTPPYPEGNFRLNNDIYKNSMGSKEAGGKAPSLSTSKLPPYPTYELGMQSGPNEHHMLRRKPPPVLSPLRSDVPMQARRIVSSPSTPTTPTASSQLPPSASHRIYDNKGQDNRAKSLSSASKHPYAPHHSQGYNSNANLTRMQPIQQAQSLHISSPQQQSNGYTSGNNGRPNSSGSNSSTSLVHTFSLSSKSRSFSSLSKLTSLSSKKVNSTTSLQGNKLDRNPSSATITSQRTVSSMHKRPRVYPALLSRVANSFKDSMILTINTKDGLEYHDTFTGKDAVDLICSLVRTNDRNLALLLGRSLDAQKFFHDITYNHRLRDSTHEVYAFNHLFLSTDFYQDEGTLASSSKHGSFVEMGGNSNTTNSSVPTTKEEKETNGVNGVFTILTDCYSPTCTRKSLCYSIACPRRLEQQARLNLKPQGVLRSAVSKLSLIDNEKTKTLWHETVPQTILDKLDKKAKMRQELIYEFIYTERDYVKDLEFMTDFYILPLRNPMNNIIPEREREAFIRTVFGGVNDLLRLARNFSEALTMRQQQQKPVIEGIGDVFLEFVGSFEPFVKYSGNKVFASFEHERQQQVNFKYSRFLDAVEKKPESRKQDLASFLMKGVQRPARYQLLLNGILKNTAPESPDYKNLLETKEEIGKLLTKINIQTGESTDRHKVMILHRLLGKNVLEDKNHFKLSYNHRIIYQTTLNRKRDNEKIDVYLFEHALLLVKHKIQNKREQHKVFERPIYLPLLFVNSGYDIPTVRTIMNHRVNGSLISDISIRNNAPSGSGTAAVKLPVNILGLGNSQVHATLFAEDSTNQRQILQQIHQQQKKMVQQHDIFSLSKFETRKFHGNHKINCAVPCYGGKKLLYGSDSGVWLSTVRIINSTSNERICSDPTLVIGKDYVTQMEVLVEYSKLLVLSDKILYEFDLSCTDSLDHVKNTRSGKQILSHVASFKTGVCEGKLLVCAVKLGSNSICVFEPSNPFDSKSRNKNKKYEIKEVNFSSTPISISFLKTHLCIGCGKGFEIVSLEKGKKEPILDEADPSLDFATQKETVTPLSIHRLEKKILLSYSEFSFFINGNGWRIKHDWNIYWEGNPQKIALFYPYLLAFEPGFIEIRDVESTMLIRALVYENIRFLHSNEHEALFACEENGYDIIISIDFLNLKQKKI